MTGWSGLDPFMQHVIDGWEIPSWTVASFLWLSFPVGSLDQPKLEINRKIMQYRRYEKSYPNSTCKENCDAKKGLVPLLQVCFTRIILHLLRCVLYTITFFPPIFLHFWFEEQQQLLPGLQEMWAVRDDSRWALPAMSERNDAERKPFPLPLDRRADHRLQESVGRRSYGLCFIW